ncbi:MAG: cysteine synthase A [Eubacteriales bacterium]
MLVNSILELIGKTPMLQLNNYMEKHKIHGNMIAKLENFNPMNSVKDRAALQMIEDAESQGLITKSTTLIEATSGNAGIGLALVAAIKNYRLIIVMPDSISIERVNMLKAFDVEVVLTPSSEGMHGSIVKSKELAKEIENSFLLKQFANDSVVKVHIINTGKEILDDTKGKVDILVATVGTGGTITGIGTILKVHNPDIKIIAVEPSGSPTLSKGESGPHKIQGIGPGFVPPVLNMDILDEIITVDDINAASTTKELLTTEGLYVGISSGAAVFAAKEVAMRPENKGKNIIVILPDAGYRYMSNDIFT